MTDELARWAAERGPALRARAEEEAVALLRDALVAAALEERSSRQAAEQRPEPRGPEPEPEPGELLWAYCVLSADSPHPVHQPGVAPTGTVEPIEAAGLTALVSRVPRAEFGEQPLRRNLNDLTWLERVARAHESVLERTLEESTIVPLRLCTLYESDEGVRDMLTREAPALLGALELLAGREEWSVKVLVDPARLAEEARSRSDQVKALEGELALADLSVVEKRLDKTQRAARTGEKEAKAELPVLEKANGFLKDGRGLWEAKLTAHEMTVLKPLQLLTVKPILYAANVTDAELSGHEGDMLLNSAYLVERERVSELQDLATRLEQDHRALGARIELSGPWPPYNFVPAGTAAVP